LVFAPILSRIYSPEDYGTFAIYSSVSAFLYLFFSLGYNHAQIAVRYQIEFLKAFRISLFSILVFSFFWLISLIINSIYQVFVFDSKLTAGFYLLPVSLLFTCMIEGAVNYNIRKKYFRLNAML